MSSERSADDRTPREEAPRPSSTTAPVAFRPGQGGTTESAYIITAVGLALTAVVLVFLWLKFFRRRTMQRLLAEAEAQRLERELEQQRRLAMIEDGAWDGEFYTPSSAHPRRPLTIKEAIAVLQPDGTTELAYSEGEEDEEAMVEDAAGIKKQGGDARDGDGGEVELATVVVVGKRERSSRRPRRRQGDGDSASTSGRNERDERDERDEGSSSSTSEPVVARENTFEWVGTGPQLPPPPHLVMEPEPPPPPRPHRWYHRMLGLRQEEQTPVVAGGTNNNNIVRPVMSSTVLGAHDASAHPMALAFSFGG